ncbi:MAG: potassium channel protein [Sulfurimonas sp. RIFOXYD12_FULL_33_39]|uniref:potassium channel family protein n=1 Tax=unclassified Sulfurimonas TaxID=2623549 RepID=UPI0008C5CD06|nr:MULTISPECIES: potassium channel protein [unclassified Sulfurimonas]OHE08701.1 MAG: potassium channel protein [Sulfurimonas sp. RIFOXYD12_FULL_33_39]OHE13986.1 MAG: potassium channel protein [Sulfurimonas sp. RIFOXYD2_FULL_34_21]
MNLLEKIRNFLHWESSPKPHVTLNNEFYSQLLPFRTPLILIQMLMLVGTLGYIYIEDYTIMDAIFQSGYTFTTVGFGSLKEEEFSAVGQIFTVTLIILGFTVFTVAIGIVVDVVRKGDLSNIMKERRMLYSIARLKKHFVVCYHNDYTLEVTKELRKNHIPFVVVDPREEIHQWAQQHNYTTYLKAEPHAELTMLKAHLSSAKGLVTLSASISDNIALIASVRLFEKEHFLPRPYYVISSAESASDVEKLKKLGADTVVSPTKLTAQRVSAMAARPDMENLLEEFLYQSDNPLDMEEIEVPKYSWAVLKKLRETHIREITNTSVVGIRKKDGKFAAMPKGDVLITSECKLLVIGTQKGISVTKELLRRRDKPKELKFV